MTTETIATEANGQASELRDYRLPGALMHELVSYLVQQPWAVANPVLVVLRQLELLEEDYGAD